MHLRWMTAADVDRIAAAEPLFDYPVRAQWARRFVGDGSHHHCLAYPDPEGPDRDRAVGFVSGVEITHPDKGTEMMLYELAVDEAYRRRGFGTALIEALAGRARDRGCYGMFVLVDTDNAAALATYANTNPAESATAVMLTWPLDPTHATFEPPASATRPPSDTPAGAAEPSRSALFGPRKGGS